MSCPSNRFSLPRVAAVLCCAMTMGFLSPFVSVNDCRAEDFQLHFRNGDVLTADVKTESIKWLSVGSRGKTEGNDIRLSEIKSIDLTSSPASEQLVKIRSLLGKLASDVYLDRQTAESELRVAGRRFRKLLEKEVGLHDPETNYRLERVISKLKTTRGKEVQELDRMVQTSGRKADGDAGNFSLDCVYRGEPMEVPRGSLIRIAKASSQEDSVASNGQPIEVQVFHQHEAFVDRKNQRVVDFAKSSRGKVLKREDDVATEFVDDGVKFGTPNQKGFVGVSGYTFSFNELPVTGNSICVYRTRQSLLRFQGIMELTFCMPGEPGIQAGVHEVGLFIARVNHSRDFIAEAYDEFGHLLATVESTDQQCSFAGLKSSQPIAKVRILSNPYLDKVTRVVDLDYAVDTVYLSKKPVPIVADLGDKILFRNGDLVLPKSFSVTKGQLVEFETQAGIKRSVEMKELAAIGFVKTGQAKFLPLADSWNAMLDDGSVLRVDAGNALRSELLGKDFKPAELAAIWPASESLRYPMVSDFEMGNNVLVYPTCRIATLDLEFTKEGFTWDEATKIEEKLVYGPEKKTKKDVDPTPDRKAEYYTDKVPKDQPTVWISKPKSVSSSLGAIQLRDGQQIVFGDGARFKLVEIQPAKQKDAAPDVVVEFEGAPITIPGKSIESLRPAK